jgi:hypothetical protein
MVVTRSFSHRYVLIVSPGSHILFQNMEAGNFRMSTETMVQDNASPREVAFWEAVFDLSDRDSISQTATLRRVQVRREDVLTAKLETTIGFYKALEEKTFAMLPSGISDLGRVLDIFCILACFDNLARSRFGGLMKPAFWVRTGDERKSLSPALPVETAARLCGLQTSHLRASLVPLVKDGAVEFVRSPSGVAAILIKPGFVNTMTYKSLLQA